MQSSPTYNLLGLLAARLPPGGDCASAHADVNGIWRCDDGGLYFVRQIGPDVLWYGEGPSDKPFFANVAHGRMEDDNCVRLMWADVPKGTTGACGALVLRVRGDGQMHVVTVSGGFGGRVWTR
jgi:hypothetical protein